MHHVFVAGDKRFSISTVLVFAIYAMLSLRKVAPRSSYKVQAIKLLRQAVECGLAEAKWVVDYIEEHATLDDRGVLNIYRKTAVQYLGTEYPQENPEPMLGAMTLGKLLRGIGGVRNDE